MLSLASCGGNNDSAKPSNKTNNTASVEPKPDTGSGKDTGGKLILKSVIRMYLNCCKD